MVKLIYGANVSLDGFLEDEDGNFDWGIVDHETHTFWNEFQQSIGTYLYGRRMYETMVYWETANDSSKIITEFAEMWRAADKIVYSRTLQDASSKRTTLKREFDVDEILNLKKSADKDITISGAELAGQAMKAGLVDECHLLVNPIVIGGGKSAFSKKLFLNLELIGTHHFKNNVVHLHYRIVH
jgi:dihydrofolate reductase